MLEDLLILMVRLIPAVILAAASAYAVYAPLSFLAGVTRQDELYPFRDKLTGMVFAGILLCAMTPYCMAAKLVIGGYLLWTTSRLALRKLNDLMNTNCWRYPWKN